MISRLYPRLSYIASAAGLFLAAPALAAEAYNSTQVVTQVVQQATQQTTGLISSRISQAVSNVTGNIVTPTTPTGAPRPNTPTSLLPGGEGKAAGDAPERWGIWANVGNSWLSGDQANADFRGTLQTMIVGIDKLVTDNLLVGTALGYEHADIRLKFNNGKFKANNLAIAPYAAYVINDVFSIDATGGYSWLNYDFERNNNTITGDTTGSRWFGVANLSANTTAGAWQLGSSLGYLYMRETNEAYRESNGTLVNDSTVHLGQARANFRAGYPLQANWGSYTPYALVRFEYDVDRSPPSILDTGGTKAYDSRFGTTFGFGVNLVAGNGHFLSLEASTLQFREDLSNYSIVGSYRYRF